MKATVKPTQDPERLKENLEKRVEKIELENGKLKVEVNEEKILERTPGIESYKIGGEEEEGLKGRPVQEEAYAKIESKEDAVKALIATIDGYDLRILNTSRQWDLKNLKRYNPDIKHLKFEEPKEFLEIEKSLTELEGVEKVDIEVPEDEVETIYRNMLT